MTNEDALYLIDNLNNKNNWIVVDSTFISNGENTSGVLTSNKAYIKAAGNLIVLPIDVFMKDYKIHKMWLTNNYSDACVIINIRGVRSNEITVPGVEKIFDESNEVNVDDIIDKYNL